ncbi:secreted protein, putative [Ixodes scapularis]|uniref:Secreted protein, putative n=1 Tax=Ixodes scapularis TaxID=6945 RepID=B7P7J7_IXOSC|nr:secreted protein, putative [Ixodes scapularis]|eukprot:XP_002399240.1 secreted protein, putative [Ixodes scapularis]
MKNSGLIVLGAIAVLVGTASASNNSCIKISFPGFFNIGKCVTAIGNTCNGISPTQALSQFTQFINCSVAGISSLTLGSQLSLLSGLITYVASRIPFIGPIITGVLRLCTGTNPLPGCNIIQIGNNSVCQDPITFSFPSVLGVEKCTNNLTQVCQNGQPATTSYLV